MHPSLSHAGLPPVLRLSPDVAEAYERAMSTGKAAVDLPAEGWFRFEDHEPHSFASCGLIVDFSAAGFSTWLRAQAAAQGVTMVWDATIAITLSWHRAPAGQWLQFSIRTEVLSENQHEFTVKLWDEEGRLVATSTQLQMIKLVREDNNKANL